MDDRLLVKRLLEIGVSAHQKNPDAYAMPADDPKLKSISVATIASWLEELGRLRLIGKVQPCFTKSGAGLMFQVSDHAVCLLSDTMQFDTWLNNIFPSNPDFDVFISYASRDSAIANELRNDLQKNDLKCFMAEKDIQAAMEWQDSIRDALKGSKRVLVLLTPRSINRPWVLIEIGAAWALGKPLIPTLFQVTAKELFDPIRLYQARVIETTVQRQLLVNELTGI